MPEAEDQMPEIPPFMKRGKQAEPEPEDLETETAEIEATPENLSASLNVILDRIKELSAKRATRWRRRSASTRRPRRKSSGRM